MFDYNPGVNDRSGEILAAGTVGAAQTNADMMSGIGQNIGNIIQQFAGAYANNKAMDAKASAYGSFLKNHGEQLGFNPEWIAEYAKAPRDQQIAMGDMMTGGVGNQMMQLNYLNRKADVWGRGAGGGGGGAAGGDGGITF